MKFSHSPAGTNGVNLRLEESPGAGTTSMLLALEDHLRSHPNLFILDTVIGYRSLVVFFCPESASRSALLDAVERFDPESCDNTREGQLIKLPVWYSPESGPDLAEVADLCGISIDELVRLHTAPIYDAAATGFAPGFCYLGQTPARLTISRLPTPRRLVAAGSVAIADNQTAVYPTASPGGWRLLGRCPIPLVSLDWPIPVKIQVGDRVQFYPITREEFTEMGGIP
jgi:KipI family sensor histidine kinase inhibitor